MKGKCKGSNGFRVAFYNDKNSEYFYSGKIERGKFEFNTNITVNDIPSYIAIRRPISTINIDYLDLSYLEIKTEEYKKIVNINKEFEYL